MNTNVIIQNNNNIERFSNKKRHLVKQPKKDESKEKVEPTFREAYVAATDCVNSIRESTSNEVGPSPNDPSADQYGPFSYLGACNWDKFKNMKVSSSKLDSCPGCPVNDWGTISDTTNECKAWCASVPGCNAFTQKDNICSFHNQAYYTKPTIQEDTYIKKPGTNDKWIMKKDEKIPNDFMNRHHSYKYKYNNLSTQKIKDGYPYYPQPYLKGISPDFATFKNSTVDQCKSVCASDKQCEGVTFNHLNNECTMKRKVLNGEYNTQKSKGNTTYICESSKPYHNKFPKDWY
ncbi:hypothetical protein CPAV1605_1335 [seawater metagenome]|uniref:Apple domain-containing protein n=1 Tax=seawater metagenome TaxID=1561972 RepID=A0A5E8CJI9_9ZZZZ